MWVVYEKQIKFHSKFSVYFSFTHMSHIRAKYIAMVAVKTSKCNSFNIAQVSAIHLTLHLLVFTATTAICLLVRSHIMVGAFTLTHD
jgi:hypothetical protein